MKLTIADLRKLRWHGLLALGLMLAAWSIADGGIDRARQARLAHETAKSRMQLIDNKLRQVRSEAQEIRERSTLFQQLSESGISSAEKRLEWIELLGELKQQLRLPGMDYEFGPQVAIDSVEDGCYAYHSSHLHMQLQLLHEGDLLNFTQQLQQRAQAMVLVRSCRLARTASASEADAGLPELNAECEMEWVTLRQTSGAKQP